MDILHETYIQQKQGEQITNMLTDNSVPEYNHHWTGKIIDNNDPIKLGRCKIRIVGFYDELDDNALPWAMPETTYFGSSKGNFTVPPIGTLVRGYFDNGDDQKPIYTAIAPNVDNYTTTDLVKNPDEAFDYPNIVTLFNSDEGERATLNRATGELKLIHRSGTSIMITPKGEIKIETNALKSRGTPSRSSASLPTEIGAEVSISGPITVVAQNDINVTAKLHSTVNITAQGGSVNIGDNAVDTVDPETGAKVPSPTKRKVNNLPQCLFTGAPHCDPLSIAALNVYV